MTSGDLRNLRSKKGAKIIEKINVIEFQSCACNFLGVSLGTRSFLKGVSCQTNSRLFFTADSFHGFGLRFSTYPREGGHQ